MIINQCSRCGSFHTTDNDVCPKCMNKDILELSTFKSYIEENGISSIDNMATDTGITQKTLTRFLGYQEIEF